MRKLWDSFSGGVMISLMYLVLAAPFLFILYMLLSFLDLEKILYVIVPVFYICMFAYNFYGILTDKPVKKQK